MKSKRQINREIAGAVTDQKVPSIDHAVWIITQYYPGIGLRREGSSGGWSWTKVDGQVVAAASLSIDGSWWLAIRPKSETNP